MFSRFNSHLIVTSLFATWIASIGACKGLQGTVDPGSNGGSTVKPNTGGIPIGGNATGGSQGNGGSVSGGQTGTATGGTAGESSGGGTTATGGTTPTGGSGVGGSTAKDAGVTKDTAQIRDTTAGHDGEVGPIACDDITSNSRLGIWNYVDSTTTSIQDVQLHLDLLNFTALSAQLSQVTVRYWFTDEDTTTPNEVAQYYVPPRVGIVKTKFIPLNPIRKDANTVLEISFVPNPDAGISFVETTKFDLAFHKANYKGAFDLSNDFSFDPKLQKTFGPNPKITAYIKGVLSWGCEPPELAPSPDAGQDAAKIPTGDAERSSD